MAYGTSDYLRDTAVENVPTTNRGANGELTGKAAVVVSQPSAAYDPIFDHDSGKKTSVTASALVITPPAGCKWVRVSSNVDILLHTAGEAAVDNDETIYIVANIPEIVPATAGVAFYALSTSGTATVRCTPLKARA